MGLGHVQWGQVTEQEAVGRNWNIGSSNETWENTSLLWGLQRTGTSCPDRLWNLLLRRYSKPAWTLSCVIYSGVSALVGGWARWSSEIPANPYNSLILWLWPGGVWRSLRMETPQHLWAACTSGLTIIQERSTSCCLDRTFCVSVCAHCFMSGCWAPLKSLAMPSLHFHSSVLILSAGIWES